MSSRVGCETHVIPSRLRSSRIEGRARGRASIRRFQRLLGVTNAAYSAWHKANTVARAARLRRSRRPL